VTDGNANLSALVAERQPESRIQGPGLDPAAQVIGRSVARRTEDAGSLKMGGAVGQCPSDPFVAGHDHTTKFRSSWPPVAAQRALASLWQTMAMWDKLADIIKKGMSETEAKEGSDGNGEELHVRHTHMARPSRAARGAVVYHFDQEYSNPRASSDAWRRVCQSERESTCVCVVCYVPRCLFPQLIPTSPAAAAPGSTT
jgi:hypothetical protein